MEASSESVNFEQRFIEDQDFKLPRMAMQHSSENSDNLESDHLPKLISLTLFECVNRYMRKAQALNKMPQSEEAEAEMLYNMLKVSWLFDLKRYRKMLNDVLMNNRDDVFAVILLNWINGTVTRWNPRILESTFEACIEESINRNHLYQTVPIKSEPCVRLMEETFSRNINKSQTYLDSERMSCGTSTTITDMFGHGT